ncbi:hypothetical protein ABTZ99_34735 [Actinosynnema sp. NPDC002837]
MDSRPVLFLDGHRCSTDFPVIDEPFADAVYSAHDYALPGIARDGRYPGTTRGGFFDRGVVEQTFLRRTEFMRRTGTPSWIGEFGPVLHRGRVDRRVTRPDCAYLRRVAPVLAKKARLGADVWSGDDRGVRHVLGPLEELFDREFPTFDPYPWGRRPWVNTLVRNILFAEPQVDDFGRCFAETSVP